MNFPLTVRPHLGHDTFLHSEPVYDLDSLQADIAYLGIPYGSAYTFEAIVNDQSRAPMALRQASERILRSPDRHDFDIGGTLYNGQQISAVDCGDVRAHPVDADGHTSRAEEAVRKILKAGAMPIILGGDHAVPIPVLRAFADHGPITLVQIDQHLDWRDHINGVRDGLSSPMRRASEMAHIDQIFQIGIRATGSARPEELKAALDYGAHIITAYEVHDQGMEAVLEKIPANGRYYLTVDLDGMDPSIAPAVEGPCPGGITFLQARTLIHGLVRKGRVVGMDVVEITPSFDINGLTSVTAGRLIVNLVGMAVRAGYFMKGQQT